MADLLSEYYKTIDNLDDGIIKMLNLRLHYCWFVGKYKRENNILIDTTERDAEILNRLKEKAEFDGMVEPVWNEILNLSRSVEENNLVISN